MRITSNRESIEKEEVTILSLFETGLASLFSWYIYWASGSIFPILLATSVAPFLLLKSKESVSLGLRLHLATTDRIIKFFDKIMNSTKDPIGFAIIFMFLIIVIIIVVSSLAIRIVSTVVTVFRMPITSIASIPSNWREIALCTDSFTAPELVPGAHKLPADAPTEVTNISMWWGFFVEKIKGQGEPDRNFADKIKKWLVMSFVIFFSAAPALGYRFSLKSTFIIWSPLIWVTRPLIDTSSFDAKLSRNINTSISSFVRIYSGIIIVVFLAKYVSIYLGALATENWIQDQNSLLFRLVEPRLMPWWQIAAFINSFLSFILYFMSDYYLNEKDNGAIFREDFILLLNSSIHVLKNTLSIYTIICAIYIYYDKFDTDLLKPFGGKIVPWI